MFGPSHTFQSCKFSFVCQRELNLSPCLSQPMLRHPTHPCPGSQSTLLSAATCTAREASCTCCSFLLSIPIPLIHAGLSALQIKDFDHRSCFCQHSYIIMRSSGHPLSALPLPLHNSKPQRHFHFPAKQRNFQHYQPFMPQKLFDLPLIAL